MTGVIMRRGEDTQIHQKNTRDNRSGDLSDASTSHGAPRISGSQEEAGRILPQSLQSEPGPADALGSNSGLQN